MEHEVFVPVPVELLREALADPARVARAVPGLQQDAGTAPVSGRLKVRVGGHTITYRGALRVAAGPDSGSYAVEGDATEARGSGSVKLALTLSLRPAEGGSTLTFGGTASADGRIADLPPDAVASATTRLLNRCAENLARASASGGGAGPGGAVSEETASEETASPGPGPGPGAGAGAGTGTEGTAEGETDAGNDGATEPEAVTEPEAEREPEPEAAHGPEPEPEAARDPEPPTPEEPPSVHETEAPPPSVAPFAEGDFEGGFEDDSAPPPEAPAEAAHARRTMIGRSAEEVDHAPPRGRYAPVPAPEAAGGSAALRWAAPAAALVLASAIVVTRVLRKRR